MNEPGPESGPKGAAPDVARLQEELRAERKRREATASSFAMLEVVLSNIDDGILLLDSRSHILYCNQALANLFDFTTERICVMSRDQFVRQLADRCEDPEGSLEKLAPIVGSLAESSVELEIEQPKWMRLRFAARPVVLPAGYGLLVIITDITTSADMTVARERLALTDALTGLHNRRAAEQAIAREVARSGRIGRPFSFALFDVDHFKKVNDTYGHAMGDRVLQEVARVISRLLRKGDLAARWGGEEFLAILGDVGRDGAHTLAERIRRETAALDIDGVRITISAGLAECRPGDDPAQALERADAKLYEAKSSGRNRVC